MEDSDKNATYSPSRENAISMRRSLVSVRTVTSPVSVSRNPMLSGRCDFVATPFPESEN